nr:hypothetical protein [Tanacetum cinerariifolium]
IKFRNYKECLKNQTIGDNSHSSAVNAVFEINQLKEQLQGKDDIIRKLQTHINIISMLNVKPTIGSSDKQALEIKLTQLKYLITSVRIQNDGFKVKDKQEKDKIGAKPDKNEKRRKARQCQILVTVEKAEKKKIQSQGTNTSKS